jgi:outer membrane lipoprotein-sorting protein
MAYINLAGGLKINTADAVDSRLVLSKNEMLTMHYDDTRPAVLAGKIFQLPDHYLCVCSDDGKVYLYDSTNEESEETGKFTLFDPQGVALVKVTYSELVALRDAGELIPGQQYRITDYVTTTVQLNTQSAGHQFDIIVTADAVNKLNENARAVRHEGDNYFANSKLEAWKLKYCLDNDVSRFAWADSVNGKGVIYRMIDEFNNDVPYDFKNIQFKRKLTDGELDLDDGIDTWVYTFTMSDMVNGKVVDISLKQNTEYMDDEGQYRECANNLIKEAILDYEPDGLIRIQLNDNVFLNIFDEDYSDYYGCYANAFGNNCRSNTFGNNCRSNTFGDGCTENTFGDECSNNTFGDNCSYNTFGNYCYYNTFGNDCYSNTFGNNCSGNTFGNSCWNNTFGDGCHSNTFGNDCYYNNFGYSCYSNTFGNGCGSNTFGNDCNSNTFGNNCSGNTFVNRCYYNTFGNDCYYLKISDNTGIQKKHISVDSGVQGASNANKFDLYDSAILNKDYQVTFKKSASGKYLMLWATDTGTMTGKVKDSNIDNTWEDIV